MRKLFYSTILLLTIISCSKDDNNPIQQENFVKLESNTIEIQSDVSITNISDNSVTINTSNNDLEKLKTGDVIVSGSTTKNPNGYARKIVSVEKNGNEIKLETVQAKINEVFEEINIKTPLGIDYSKNPIISSKNSKIGKKNQSDSTFYDNLKFKYNASTNKFDYEVQFKKDLSSKLKGKLSFKGSFQIEDEGSQFVYNVRPFTEKVFLIENRMKVIMENAIIASGSLSAKKKTFELAKIPLTFTLPTSLVVNIYLVIRIGVSGEISAEFEVKNTTTLTMDQSLSYTEDSKWLASGFSTLTSETGFEGKLELGIKSYFEPGIKIVFEQFRGINAGIYVENYLKFDAELNSDLNINWDLGYGIKVKGEAKVKFLDDNFINEDYELIFWEKPYTKFTEGTFEIPQKIHEGNVILTTQKEVDDFGNENYTVINGDLNILFAVFDINKLNSLKKITGSFVFEAAYVESLNGLNNLRNVGKDFIIKSPGILSNSTCAIIQCTPQPLSIKNIEALSNLSYCGGKIELNYLVDVIDFCPISELLLSNNNFTIIENGYNPTLQDIQNGKCSQ